MEKKSKAIIIVFLVTLLIICIVFMVLRKKTTGEPETIILSLEEAKKYDIYKINEQELHKLFPKEKSLVALRTIIEQKGAEALAQLVPVTATGMQSDMAGDYLRLTYSTGSEMLISLWYSEEGLERMDVVNSRKNEIFQFIKNQGNFLYRNW